MDKNTVSKWTVFAFNRTTNAPLTGDAANITANLRLDGGAANAVDDVNPTELEDGFYVFDITAAEANADNILISPASSTANIQVIGCPAALYTRDDFTVTEIRQEMDSNSTRLAAIETDTTGINGEAMRGTNSAATATALATVDSNVDAILVDTGTTIPGTITTVDSNVDAVLVDTGTTLPAILATIDGIVDNILTDTGTTIPGTITTAQNDLNVITGSDGVTLATAQALYAPNKTVPDAAGTASGLHSTTDGLINTIDTVVDAIYAIVNSGIHGNSALKTLIDALPATSDVNAQVADVLKTDTVAEMAQGSPPASPTMEQILNYMYRALRNKIQTTATETAVYNDAGSTKLIKATVSDDATTFTKNEYVSGA